VQSFSSCRAAPLQRESTLVLGTQFFNWHPCGRRDGIGTKRTEWQALLGSIGRREESHGVNPETRNGYKEGLVAAFSTVFPQLWK
jgi:hypothetical protein